MNAVVPVVSDYMTPAPEVIAPNETLSRARSLMRERAIRHLPVMENGRVVGIISDRDVNLVEKVVTQEPAGMTVEEVMTPSPYWVPSEAPLQQVARAMAERKIGSAVVMDHGVIAGVFTVTDALTALADALEGKFMRRVYDDVTTEPRGGRRPQEPDIR